MIILQGKFIHICKVITWTKATAAHFLAKALLFRSSERNDDWNSAYVDSDLQEA